MFLYAEGKTMSEDRPKTPLQHRQYGAPLSLYRFLGSTDNFVYSDERLRPTWERDADYRLTAEHRRQLCIHLAAHAAVSSMGGAGVYMLAVAPVGVRTWTISDRKSPRLGKIWGVCSTSDFYCHFIKWDVGRQIYVADREGWENFSKSLYEDWHEHQRLTQMPLNPGSGKQGHAPFPQDAPTVDVLLADDRRVVRAQACGYLAGHIADGISAGMHANEALRLYDRRDTQYVGPSDIAVAQGLTDLLPPGEYENAVQVTEQALRRPDVWEVVQRVAADLERFGLIEGDECEAPVHEFLPKTEHDWPPGPGYVTP